MGMGSIYCICWYFPSNDASRPAYRTSFCRLGFVCNSNGISNQLRDCYSRFNEKQVPDKSFSCFSP